MNPSNGCQYKIASQPMDCISGTVAAKNEENRVLRCASISSERRFRRPPLEDGAPDSLLPIGEVRVELIALACVALLPAWTSGAQSADPGWKAEENNGERKCYSNVQFYKFMNKCFKNERVIVEAVSIETKSVPLKER